MGVFRNVGVSSTFDLIAVIHPGRLRNRCPAFQRFAKYASDGGAIYANDRGAMYANDRLRFMLTTECDLCERQEPRTRADGDKMAALFNHKTMAD